MLSVSDTFFDSAVADTHRVLSDVAHLCAATVSPAVLPGSPAAVAALSHAVRATFPLADLCAELLGMRASGVPVSHDQLAELFVLGMEARDATDELLTLWQLSAS